MNDDLILNNLKFINYVMSKMNLNHNNQDYYDVGLQALIIAKNTFNENKGYKFSTYAVNCIKYELIKYINFEKCYKRKSNYNIISLEQKIYSDKLGNDITLLDILDNGENLEEDILKKEKIELLKTIISILEPKDKFMMEHYFELWGNEKMEQKEIAKFLGVKQGYVSYRIKRSMKIIKKIMEEKY